jgi:glycosyltransferase involved in cell wall biosynthesis
MPKIVLGVSSSFCANFLKGQIDFLVKSGWEVVLISGPGEEISLLAKKEQAKLYTINFTKSIAPFEDLGCLWQIIKILKKEQPDIINAGNPKSGFLIMCAAWLLRIPARIFTMHGLLSDSKKGLVKAIIKTTERISCSIAKEVIVVSPSLKVHAVEVGIVSAAKCVVIENGSCNGVNTTHFQRNPIGLADAEKLERELNWQPENLVIGFVGRLSKDKGIDILFEAFNILAQQYPQIRLLLVGPLETNNPFSKKHIQQLYFDGRISYVGKVYDVVPAYMVMDMLVLSSYREGFGNVLIEAAAMELPVIAPDIPGCRNALQPAVNGLLFKKASVEDLVARMEIYIKDKDLRKLHGTNGRNFVINSFSQEKIWKGQLAIYLQLIAGK